MKKIYNPLFFSFLLLNLFIVGHTFAQQKEVSLLPEKVDQVSENWEKDYWSKKEHYNILPANEHSETAILVLDTDSLSFSRWFKKIPAQPYSKYKLSFKIRTENIQGEKTSSGAGIRVGEIPFTSDTVFIGDIPWSAFEIEFETKADDSFFIECILGKNGLAKGKVWFAELKLSLISSKKLEPKVSVLFDRKKEKMSPYIYGQFIEHMGRCIYGGIWAEMIQDRKFYHLPGSKESPWEIIGDTMQVSLDSTDVYSKRNNTALISTKKKELNGLKQTGLGLQSGKNYEGRIVLKADKGIKSLRVSLSDGNETEEMLLKIKGEGYRTYPLSFSTHSDSDNGILEIIPDGNGDLHIAAVSLMPDDNISGFRKDVLELMKELNAPIYRWPGGNFVSGYNWKDGIGDPDKRPTRYERAWKGLEYNDVGVHEFMELCKLLNAEANIAVNTGLGTAKMAAEEVEYFNGDSSTPMGKWRAENGHPEPYDVKLWAVGNEMFGEWQLGHMPVDDYVKKHNEVAKAMWEVDPDIELIAVGFPGHWNDMMYEHCSDNMTFISEHFYKQDWHAGGLMTHVMQIPDVIKAVAEEHRRCRREIPEMEGKEIKIAMDEWNYWYGPHVYGLLGTRYFLRDALGIAAGINEFSRQSDIYYMANYAQTVNVIGAIKTTKTGSFLEGTGQVLKLYRDKFASIPVEMDGFAAPLDVAATVSEDGKQLTLSVVNPTNETQILDLNIKGVDTPQYGKYYYLTGKDDMVYNDFDEQRILLAEEIISSKSGKFLIPKISAGIIEFDLK